MARQLDPLSAVTNADEGHFLYAARHFGEAQVRLQEAIELEAELGQPHETLALVELESGHPADAVKEAHAGLVLDPNAASTGEPGYVLSSVGQTGEAHELLARLKGLEHQGSFGTVGPTPVTHRPRYCERRASSSEKLHRAPGYRPPTSAHYETQ